MPLEYVQFGTLYLDDIPAALGIKVFPNQAFRLGDTCSTCAIPWVFDGKKYVAIRNVCNNVSWEDLVFLKRGFDWGRWIHRGMEGFARRMGADQGSYPLCGRLLAL